MQPLVVVDDYLRVKGEDYELVLAKCGVKDKMVRDSIASVRDWYKMQLHLPEGAFTDGKIFRILLATDYSLEKTKRKIDNLLTARRLIPEMLTDRDPGGQSIKTVRQFIEYAIIPQRLDDTTRLFICGFKGEDFSNYVLSDIMKFSFMSAEYLATSDVCLGNHYIIDWRGVKLGHVTQATPGVLKKVIFLFQECYGAKIKSLHHTNVPSYGEFVVSILKNGFSEKLSSRLHLHRDYESLHTFFPKSVLPSDFGGENVCMKELVEDSFAQLMRRREWFLEMDKFQADESKRVGVGSAMSKELQGLQGSFRTLDID